MALVSSCKSLATSLSASVPDFNGNLQENPTSKVAFPQRDACERRHSRSSHAAAPPHAIKASSSSCLQGVSAAAIESRVQKTQVWDAMESVEEVSLSTELKRSQLERQWARIGEYDHVAQRQRQKGNCRRLSARQRRILARRQQRNGMPTHQRCGRAMSASLLNGMSPPQRATHYNASPSSALSRSDRAAEGLIGVLGAVSTVGFLRHRVSKELLTKEEEALLAKKMKVGQNLRAARERLTKALGHEPSDELWALSVKLSSRELHERLLEADRARDHIFLANLRLVVSVAKKYTSLGINLADLTQEGAAGLLRGLEKFNYKKGFKLSTYVHWWIRQGVTQALGEHSKTVRIPPYMYAKLTLVLRTMTKFRESGIPISVRNLSTALNMPEDIVSIALKATKKMISLDKPKNWGGFSSEGDSLHNYVADSRAEYDPWNMVDSMSLREHLDVLMTSTLCKREQEIIRLYYGFECPKEHGLSYHRIGQRMGISRERARQLEVRALRKLVVAGRQMNLGVPLSY